MSLNTRLAKTDGFSMEKPDVKRAVSNNNWQVSVPLASSSFNFFNYAMTGEDGLISIVFFPFM